MKKVVKKKRLKTELRHQTKYLISPEVKSEGLKLLFIHSYNLGIDEKDFIIKTLNLREITEKQKIYLKGLLPFTNKFYKTLVFRDKKRW